MEEKKEKKSLKLFLKNNYKKILSITLVIILTLCAFFFIYKKFISKEDMRVYTDFSITTVSTGKNKKRSIDNDSTFIIETNKKANVESIKRRVYVEPSIDYDIKQVNYRKYELVPKDDLVSNQVYKVKEVKNETVTYEWSFETKRELTVINYSPNYNSSNDDVITVDFSMEDVKGVEDNINIVPSISGSWSKINSSYVFTPKEKFKDNTLYTVEIGKGITSGDYKLAKPVTFSFIVGSDDNNKVLSMDTMTMDGINTFTSKDKPKIKINYYEEVAEADTKVYKYNSFGDFKSAVKNSNHDVSKLNKVYDNKISIKEKVIELDKNLPSGYYIAKIVLNGRVGYQYIQVSDIQGYVINTERDTLVWTIKDGKVKTSIPVEFNGKTIKSDKNGIAKFTSINNNKNNNTYITIDSNSKNPILVEVANYDINNYPNAYIYTDRPLYKNEDTIQVWGYVPQNQFIDKISNNFVLEYSGFKKRISLNKDGTFNTTIDLKNNVDSEFYTISLLYNDSLLATRDVSIYNYVKPTYEYDLDIKKNTYSVGEKISFDVTVTHITGIKVKNKSVKARFNDRDYKAVTDAQGVAHFEINAPFEKDIAVSNYELYVYTGNYEDENFVPFASTNINVLNYDIYSYSTISGKKGDFSLTIKANKWDTAKIEKEEYLWWDYDKFVKEAYNTDVKVEIYKYESRGIESGEYYNEYSGKMEKEYNWESTEDLVKTYNVKLKDGKYTIKDLNYTPVNEENKTVDYYARMTIKDSKGREYQYTDYFYELDYDNYNGDYYDYGEIYPYSYVFKVNGDKANVGDKVSYTLTDNSYKEIENEGTVLTVFYKEQIKNTSLVTKDSLSFKFTNDLYPGVNIAGAYLKDGKVYSIVRNYVDFNEENKKLTVDVKTDKEEYKPGDEVEVTVNVKDKNNKGLKTQLNISVVDEAIFNIKEDDTSILETLFADRYYDMYQMSTDRDYYLLPPGGRGSTGGEQNYRGVFKDTAFFTTVETKKNGTATVKFKLPDNITKFRITVHAANKDDYVGVNTKTIVSTNDFFIESVTPTGVKYSDDLVINAISHGKKAKDDVKYTFEVNGKKQNVDGIVDEYVSANFGKFDVGEYEVKISAKNGELSDAIKYTVKIVGYTQEVPDKTTVDIIDKTNIKATKSPIKLEIYDNNLEKYLKYIDTLQKNFNVRVDTQIGYYEASRLNQKYYNDDDNDYVYPNLDNYIYDGLVTKYGKENTGDLLLTAITKKYANLYFLSYYGESIDISTDYINKLDNNLKNKYRLYLYKAASSEAILEDLDTLKTKDKDRDIEENVTLALAYAFSGDYDNAKSIYKSLKVKIKDNEIYVGKNKIENDDISSLISILASMVDKGNAANIIDLLIQKNSTSTYLNFAIISYLEHSTSDIEVKKTITVNYGKNKEKVSVNGFKVKEITLNNKDLDTLKFENASKNLKVSYYYTTSIDEISSNKIKKDVKTSIKNKVNKNEEVNLNVKYTNNSKEYSDIKIVIPRGLAYNSEELKLNDNYYVSDVKNNYLVITVSPKQKKVDINIPFVATNNGRYVFEPVVIYSNDIFHISGKLNIEIKK